MPTYEYWCEACNHMTARNCSLKEHSQFFACEKCQKEVEQIVNATTWHQGEGAWESNRYTGKSNVRWRDDK